MSSELAGSPVLTLCEGSSRSRGKEVQQGNIVAFRIVTEAMHARAHEALKAIPTTLAENAGLDPIDILSELKARHEIGQICWEVKGNEGKVKNMHVLGVFEPLFVKKQIVKSVTVDASITLKIDDVVVAGNVNAQLTPPGGPGAPGLPPGMGL